MAFQDLVVQGVSSGGNFLSAVERIKAELTRNRPEDDDFIKRALATRMKFYSTHRFDFNEKSASMLTEPGVHEYGPADPVGSTNGYPADLMEIDQIQVFRDPETTGGNALNDAYPMERVQFDTMRYWIEASSTGNRPHWYSWYANRFFVFPASAGVQHRLLFDYHADIERPRYQFVGGEWHYFDSTGSPINDDYSTPWLEHAEELIRNGAKADLFANVFSDEGSVPTARGQELEALRSLEVLRNRKLATGSVRPHFSGDWGGVGRYPHF